MKRYLVALLLLFSSIPFPQWGYAANSDIIALQGSGTFNNVDVFRIDANDNVYISSYNVSGVAVPHTTINSQGLHTFTGPIVTANVIVAAPSKVIYGSTGTAVSTTTTAGSGQGQYFQAFLASGTSSPNALEGSVLCSTTSQQGNQICVTVCPSSGNVVNWIGVAAAAASSGTIVSVYTAGAWTLALTTGPVNEGDLLVTTTTSQGFLSAQMTGILPNIAGAQVAVALGKGNAAGGTTKVRLR